MEQTQVNWADTYWGEPQSTSLKAQSALVGDKPKCDVLVVGHAYSAQDKPLCGARQALSGL